MYDTEAISGTGDHNIGTYSGPTVAMGFADLLMQLQGTVSGKTSSDVGNVMRGTALGVFVGPCRPVESGALPTPWSEQ